VVPTDAEYADMYVLPVPELVSKDVDIVDSVPSVAPDIVDSVPSVVPNVQQDI